MLCSNLLSCTHISQQYLVLFVHAATILDTPQSKETACKLELAILRALSVSKMYTHLPSMLSSLLHTRAQLMHNLRTMCTQFTRATHTRNSHAQLTRATHAQLTHHLRATHALHNSRNSCTIHTQLTRATHIYFEALNKGGCFPKTRRAHPRV